MALAFDPGTAGEAADAGVPPGDLGFAGEPAPVGWRAIHRHGEVEQAVLAVFDLDARFDGGDAVFGAERRAHAVRREGAYGRKHLARFVEGEFAFHRDI